MMFLPLDARHDERLGKRCLRVNEKVTKSMRVFVCLFVLFFLIVFSIWAYKAMVDVRPNVRRPRLNGKAREAVNALEGYLKGHVVVLAEKIGPRNVFFPEKIKATADYIRSFWEDLGYEVTVQRFQVESTSCANLSVELVGEKKPEKIVVVGGHYDTVYHSPGANDNGSAVAALLELSRLAKDKRFDWTIRFVAFTNE